MSETATKSLVKKLAAVALAVERIPKNGFNAAQNYKFTEHADVMEAIRKELASRNVVILPKVTDVSFRQIQGGQGKAITIATVRMSFDAHDGDSGEVLEVATSVGEGMDYGDKNVPKAMTGAQKSAMLKLFLCATGDDPEKSDELDRDAAAPAPRATSGQSRPAPAAQQRPAPLRQSSAGPLPDTFPNFGSQKGKPLAGAAEKDLKWYAKVLRENVADPAKSRFKADNAAHLAAVERALAVGAGMGRGPDGDDSDLHYPRGGTAPGDEDAPF